MGYKHFQSQQQQEYGEEDEEEEILYLAEDKSRQYQQQHFHHASTSSKPNEARMQIVTNPAAQVQTNSNYNLLQPSLQSPFYHNNDGARHNFDHFKSHCSEVIIRGSSETDISNRIARARVGMNVRDNSSQQFHTSSHQNMHHSNSHSHQISGCQSIVNLDHQRSQFTSIDTGR